MRDESVKITPLSKLVKVGHWNTAMLHSQPFDRLLWITRGQGQMAFNAEMQSYLPFSVTFLPAGTPHRFDIKPTVFGIAVDVAVHANLDMPKTAFSLRLRDVSEQRRFAQLIDTVQIELDRPKDPELMDLDDRALRYQAGLMGVWLERRARTKSDHTALSPSARLVMRFLDFVETRLGQGDNIASLSALLDVTPTHLTRCCRKTLGQSALELLNERLHHHARMQLLRTSTPVKDIAASLGFASAAYFTRAFQNLAQQTPSEFRAVHTRALAAAA
ncbi:MAG: AraC family transcriptional regulator [Pseudomonadota bacterium]